MMMNMDFHICVQEDKGFLAPYPGEEGYSPRRRLAILIGAPILSWVPIVASVLAFIYR